MAVRLLSSRDGSQSMRSRKRISSSQLDAESELPALPETLDLQPFRHEPVVNAVRSRESGHVEIREGKRTVIVVYYRIPSVGWTYVEQAALADLPVK